MWQTPGHSKLAIPHHSNSFFYLLFYCILFSIIIGSIHEDMQLVDTWMLWKRFSEEIGQTRDEMVTFIEVVERIRQHLSDDISNLSGIKIKQYY